MSRQLFLAAIPLGGLATAAFAAANYRRLSRAARWIFLYLCFTTAANLTAVLLAKKRINNLPLLHVDTLVETVLFALFFRALFKKKALLLSVDIVLGAFPLVCVLNAFFQGIYSYNTYPRSLEALLLIAFSSAYWLSAPAQKSLDATPWKNVASNWMVSGIQLYFTSAFFLFVYANLMADRLATAANFVLWYAHGVLTLLLYALFAAGIRKSTA